MPELMGNARQMLGMVVAASSGMLEDAEQDALSAQIVGAFAAIPVMGTNIVRLAQRKDWNGLIGAIGSYIDVQEASSPSRRTSVTNYAPVTNRNISTASSFSSSSMTFDVQFERTKAAVEYSDSLDEGEKEVLIDSLDEAKKAAEDGDHKGLAEKLGSILDLAKKGAGIAKAVLELLPMMVSLLPPG